MMFLVFPRQRALSAAICGAVVAAAAFGVPGSLRGQDSTTTVPKWRFAQVVDDMTDKADDRLVVTAEDSVSDRLGGWVRPRLILSCGNIFRGNGRKSLLFDAQMPVRWRDSGTLAGDLTELITRTDTDEKASTRSALMFHDAGHTVVYLGDFGGFFFSRSLFLSVLRANQLRVRFNPLSGNTVETVTFDVRGLEAALAMLGKCEWPK
jgi:hypothetical protein